jgi:PAS domain S-box-containing protein
MTKRFKNVSIAKKLYFTVGIMALLIAMELFTLWFALNSLSAVRAYVGGEGLWSKAQKDAVYQLRIYGRSHDESDYIKFEDFMTVPLGDHKTLVELTKTTPDWNAARQGFIEGRNHPDDIDGMIHLFRRFHNIYYIDKAIKIWAEADGVNAQLIPIGERLHAEINSVHPSHEKIDGILREIDPINQRLTVLEDNFSYTLGEGSRWLENLILKLLFIVALTVELSGLLLTISVSRGIAKGINEIILTAKSIAGGDFKRRAKIYSQDEIGILAGSFNQMTNELEQNINERRLAEEKIKGSNLQLAEAQRLAHIGSWEWDIPSNIIRWSDELYKIFGLKPEEFEASYETYLKYLHPDDKEYVHGIVQNAFADHQPFNFTHRLIKSDGSVRIISSHGEVLVNEKNEPVKMSGTAQDVTESKQALALKESEERYRTLAETASDAIITVNEDGMIDFVNKATEKVFGYTPDEITGKPVIVLMPEQFKDLHLHTVRRYIASSKTIISWQATELTGLHKNGSLIPIEVSIGEYRQNGKQIFTGIVRDITQRKKEEKQLKEAKEKAEQSSRARQEFLSVMSHEIRTPLNAVLGVTHLLMDENPLPEQAENLKILEFSANNLLSLINNILDFSKIESGKIQLEQIDFNLPSLLKQVIKTFRHNAEEKQIELNLVSQKEIPEMLIGDPVRLTQILNNLIHNAIKFTSKGSVNLNVKMPGKNANYVELLFEVSDTGIGIESNRLDDIFESFTQAELSITRQFGGTGLGLTICKKLVKLLGGEISVKSEPGKGSAFSFNLQYKIGKDHDTKHLPDTAYEKNFSLKGIKVLLAEDNLTNQLLAKKFITRWGAEVETADNGVIAVRKVNQRKYDIVLMDLQMPEMDGYEAARNIRKAGFDSAELPIIAFSAYTLDDDKTKVLAADMNDYLPKPIDPYALYRMIIKSISMKEKAQKKFVVIPSAPEDVQKLSELLESFSDDDTFLQNYLKLFKREFKELYPKISVAALKPDAETVRLIIHKIKPSLERVKGKDLSDQLNELRSVLTQNHADDARLKTILTSIEVSCNNILEEIEAIELRHLKNI